MLGRGGALLAAIAYWPSALSAIAVSGSNVVLPCVAVFFVWPTLLFFLAAAIVDYLRHPIRDGDAGSDSPDGGTHGP